MRILIFITIWFALMGCVKRNRILIDNGPLITVIKLNSAESANNRKEAEKYIDINSVYDAKKYSEKITGNTPTPNEIYDQYLKFINNIKKDKKFSSEFMYYKYDIGETILNGIADIIFNSQESDEKIVYKLKYVDGCWIVVDIVRSVQNRMHD